MNTFKKTILAAAAVATTFGAMAATTTADAGWKAKFKFGGHGHHRNYGFVQHKPSCWIPVWNGYGYVNKKFYGHACYNTNYNYNPYSY